MVTKVLLLLLPNAPLSLMSFATYAQRPTTVNALESTQAKSPPWAIIGLATGIPARSVVVGPLLVAESLCTAWVAPRLSAAIASQQVFAVCTLKEHSGQT